MPKQKYTKAPLTAEQQVELLKSRGLRIDDVDRAIYYLNRISYYRLSGYALPFEVPTADGQRSHQFKPDASFEAILDLYVFDRKLRTLVMDAMERIEVALRSQMCLYMANKTGDGWWHLNPVHFKTKYDHNAFVTQCNEQLERTPDVYIKHYFSKYDDPPTPPSWMTLEQLTMGPCSFLYMNIREPSDKNAIAKTFGLHYTILISWFQAMSYLRNLCAHHSRLWNRKFTIRPKLQSHQPISDSASNRFAAQVAIIVDMLKVIAPKSMWSTRFYETLLEHPHVDEMRMGFSDGWQLDGFWQVRSPRWRAAKSKFKLIAKTN